MTSTHIRLSKVSVHLPIYDSHSLRLIRLPSFGHAKVGTQTVSHIGRTISIHALDNINLDLTEGDRIALIGDNGSGKTTLLRLLAGIYPPNSGTVDVHGKIFALLGNNMVVNSDATGYENINLVANLYHWPKDKIDEYTRDIEEFTELGEYLSLPTRVYSAGMQTRLAFAIATAQSPDILLIDEGIGAGDAQFQLKAQQRVQKFMGAARIVVLASHSVALCKSICTRAVWLSKGREVFIGDIDEAFKRYNKTG